MSVHAMCAWTGIDRAREPSSVPTYAVASPVLAASSLCPPAWMA